MKLQTAPCVLEELAKRGFGIVWNPTYELFWPFTVGGYGYYGEIKWWDDPEDVASKDFGTAVYRLQKNVQCTAEEKS